MGYTCECLRLDIKELLKLNNGKYQFIISELKGIKLIKDTDYIEIDSVRFCIDKQKTRYGEKSFLRCPYCFRSREHIYYIKGSWKCRECGQLKYISTTTYRKGMEYCDLKIDKILDKLGVEHKIEYYTGDLVPYIKPYKMRWKTYLKLISELKYWQSERADRWINYVYSRWPK